MIKHPTASGYILDLKMGNLSSIFSIFDKIRLSDISELILSYNNLHELEDLFFQMRNLFVLNVSVNQIKEIANLDNCQKLESLNLSTNRITKFKGLEGLKALIRLVKPFSL
jgi:Leucine-rich repeat (LRR) protein